MPLYLVTSDESNDCTETLKEEIDDLKKANAILRDEVVKYYTQNTALEEESAKVQADMNKTLVLYQVSSLILILTRTLILSPKTL